MEINDPALAHNKRYYTIEEYFEMEMEADEKHEYYQGGIYAMSGAKTQHNMVTSNLSGILWNKLRGNTCKPFGSDQRIFVEKNAFVAYPDISVVCGKIETWKNDQYNVLNPTMLIEVLSPATRNYDRGLKLKLYQDIPSLKECVLIDSVSIGIEDHYINEQGQWVGKEYHDIAEKLFLSSINTELELAVIYEGLLFSE